MIKQLSLWWHTLRILNSLYNLVLHDICIHLICHIFSFCLCFRFFLQSCCHDGHDSEIYSPNCPKPCGIFFHLKTKDKIIANKWTRTRIREPICLPKEIDFHRLWAIALKQRVNGLCSFHFLCWDIAVMRAIMRNLDEEKDTHRVYVFCFPTDCYIFLFPGYLRDRQQSVSPLMSWEQENVWDLTGINLT